MRRKQLIILAIIIVLLIVIINILVNYFSTGTLKVTTAKNNNITVMNLRSGNTKKAIHATSSLTATLKTGTYNVTVSNKYFSAQKVVTINAHKTTYVSLNPDTVGQTAAVTSQPAYDPVISKNTLTFLDTSTKNIYSVGSNNTEKLLGTATFNSLHWANINYGVAQSTNGVLYSVLNNKLSVIHTPIKPETGNYNLSPNETLYISDGHSMYQSGIGNFQFKKIYTSPSDTKIRIVSVSNSGILLTEIKTNQLIGGATGTLFLIVNNKQFRSTDTAYNAQWNPNGTEFVTTTDGNSNIYNEQLQKVTQLPDNNVTGLAWLNNKTLFYSVNNQIWEYKTSTQTAQLVAKLPSFESVTQLTVDQNQAALYILVENTQILTATYQLESLPLNSQSASIPALNQQLSIYLPNNYNGCSIGYMNFGSPTNIITEAGGNSAINCKDQAIKYLQLYNINTSSLKFTSLN